jgi:hypothetical protein
LYISSSYCQYNPVEMKIISPIAFFMLLSLSLAAQSGPYLFSGANYMANGQIGLLAADAEAVLALPAALAIREHGGWTAGVSTRSGLDDYAEASGAFHLRLPWKDQVGLAIQHAGIEGYTEQRISLCYARNLVASLQAGVHFDYNRNAADEYEALSTISWGVSIMASIMNNVTMSALLYNPLGVEDELDLPSLVRIGALYTPSEKIGIALEAEKDWREDVRFKAGFNYHIHPRLTLRWGMNTNPSTVHAGIGYALFSNMALHGGWKYHSTLGSSFGASIGQSRVRE